MRELQLNSLIPVVTEVSGHWSWVGARVSEGPQDCRAWGGPCSYSDPWDDDSACLHFGCDSPWKLQGKEAGYLCP